MSAREVTNNGWNVVDGDQVTRRWIGADTDGCTFLSGPVADLFVWFFDQLHQHVEPVTMLNGWRSAADNAYYGGAAGSNHMSGTAGDVNGYKHPYEAHTRPWSSGWTAEQQHMIRLLMAQTGGLISWGLDYAVGIRDAMHFDLSPGTTPAQVAAFVHTLHTPPPPEEEDMTPEQAKTLDDIAIWVQQNQAGPVYGIPGGRGRWTPLGDSTRQYLDPALNASKPRQPAVPLDPRDLFWGRAGTAVGEGFRCVGDPTGAVWIQTGDEHGNPRRYHVTAAEWASMGATYTDLDPSNPFWQVEEA